MAKDRMLGVGVIGTGWVAGAHIDAFKQIEGTRIVAVCSRKKQRAAEKIATYGLDAEPYGDLERFLDHVGLDVVVICTQHPYHPAETIAAARAGKHIVIEKPLSLNRDDLRKMVAAVNKARVLTSVCFELRWMPSVMNAKKVIDDGLIGAPFLGACSYFHGIGPWYRQWSWNIKKRIGGDALLTAGCHALDCLMWLMGGRVTEVSAVSGTSKSNPLKYEYDPNVVATLRFDTGAIGNVNTSIECRQPYHFPITIQGPKGTVRDDELFTTEWPGLKSWAKLPAATPDSGDVSAHPYQGQLEYFVDCIRRGKRPHNDIHNAAHVHEVMFAIDQSIRQRKTIKVPRTPGT